MKNAQTQYALRMDEDLKERLKKIADKNNRSLNAEILSRLEESLIQEDRPYKVPIPADLHGVRGVMPQEMGAFILELALERADQLRQEKNNSE